MSNHDLHMITHPELWPLAPILPLKRRVQDPSGRCELGLMVNHAGLLLTVFTVNLHEFVQQNHSVGWLLTQPSKKYAKVAEITADGWLVD